jgi:hypothetical protein
MSPYAYCANNPVRYIDPTGLYKEESDANKARDKAVKRYGENNVGRVYQNKKGKYEFRISKTGFKQDSPESVKEGADASADGGTKIGNGFKRILYNIANATGIFGTADNGQGQETRKGDGKKTDLSDLTGSVPDYSGGNDNQTDPSTPQTNTKEPEWEQDGYMIHITNNQTGRQSPVWVKDSKDSARMRKWWGDKWVTVDTIYRYMKRKE